MPEPSGAGGLQRAWSDVLFTHPLASVRWAVVTYRSTLIRSFVLWVYAKITLSFLTFSLR